ncbi:protein FAM53C-like isoform X2 [Lampris incognitus]|uniref:protein FAM53C-like isoform X2 n=1 Tax=Lampris incognitus TaxID=2546036 RepID=UPI0024B4F20A|nr:protein FAM53C-like isoform X2 [Lampris incognitus]
MVTLITEQLRKQSLEEPYRKAFSFNSLPAVGSSPTVSWSTYGSTQESSWAAYPLSKAHLLDAPSGHVSCVPVEEPLHHPQGPSTSVTDLTFQSSPPPPPPPKRHCRSLSVPEDLSRCRSTWRPSASKVWTPVKRRCQSGGVASIGSAPSSLPLRGPSASLTSSSLHSSSSPTFFSLALSSDSPLPWSFPWDPSDTLRGACSNFLPAPSSCSSSPAPLATSHSLLQRRFSLSPVHIREASVPLLPAQPSRASALTTGCSAMDPPAPSPSPTSACSTPSSSRRVLRPCLPRCHSQPCDMRKPRLKRRHDPDIQPCPRPGLDFGKMTQLGSGESLGCRAGSCMILEPSKGDRRSAFSPAEFMGRNSIGPLSESEEEEEDKRPGNVLAGVQKIVFERDCTELDLNLIEEN